ncbi:MAG: ribonuclease T [Epsilonproteobacteria bacterium]|nr:ribonuclease T [Campylobacterota bacterium]NPA56796.1 ribonuclease T [Campylobacterota bacterium]
MMKILLPFLLALSLFAKEMRAVLAVQWFPSVCKVERYRECRKPLPFWLSNFTLHGLWPKGREYCKVSARQKILDKRGRWDKIPLKLSPQLQELLYTYMPGSLSGLHNHEWVKHGSCYGDPEIYFLDSIALVSQLNDSPVRQFFLDHRGKIVQTYKIRRVFDKAFGKGAGKRVKFICKRGYLTEMRINLKGEISSRTPLADLILKAPRTRRGCSRGRIAR